MARILIVEDQPLIAEELRLMIAGQRHEPVGPARTIDAALAMVEEGRIDGALLDVELGDGKTSFPIASALDDQSIPYVFVTGSAAGHVRERWPGATVESKPLSDATLCVIVGSIVASMTA